MNQFTDEDHTVMELFEPYVKEWMYSEFSKLTPPQRAAWPLIAEGNHTLIFSPTGSGKTLAAFLFCINELFKKSVTGDLDDTIYVLYISPLRALSNDIHRNLYAPLKGIYSILKQKGVTCQPIRSQVRTGDTTSAERARMARKPPHILITTPETLYIVLTTEKFRENLRNITYVIVDEIHALAGSKRGVQLSVSLERLASFLGYNPVRIGLSATQSPVEEIAKFLAGVKDGVPRPCEIVDIGARKTLDVKVVSPVDNLLEAKNDVIWNAAYAKLLDMVKDHETTLIFTNSRYRTESMALTLRELGDEFGLHIGSHHGSMSRVIRQNVEERLKQNKLDAVIATSSLELGIDIGSIDLVCNVESPKSLSSGMQRVGRAGHLLKETSKGRILAVDPDDLVESAVLVRGISHSIIDTTHIPFNALDMLAQQIVACAAADDWDRNKLYTMITQSYCYHSLPEEDFERTLTMLSSQVAPKIYPKIHYDTINKNITGGRGARPIAFRCGGAIPDTANYNVYQGNTKIGTLDEGFVERMRPGDVFILGSQAWQMTGLDKKKVYVHHVSDVPPTIPYWGGTRPSRTFDLGMLVGSFRRKVESLIDSPTLEEWLQKEYLLDADGAKAVAKYYREQYMMLGALPSDTHIVVESFKNELGYQQIAVHSPFGVRVNDMWGYALMAAVKQVFNIQINVATVDDGILLTFPEDVLIDPESVIQLVTTEFLEENVHEIIGDSPVFASRFRHCAVRSFLILREYTGKRVPVWLQSLRATELLEELKSEKDFPIIKEAYRESVQDAFDLPHLMQILHNIEQKEITVTYCKTRIPSPFIHQLLLVGQFGDFGQISNEERKLRLIHLHRKVLKQLVDEDLIKGLLVEEEVEKVQKELQFLLDNQKAQSKEELARILKSLGDLTTEEIIERVKDSEKSLAFLEELCAEKRVIQVNIPFAVPEERWIPTEKFSVYKNAFAKEAHTGIHSFETVGILQDGSITYVQKEWIPSEVLFDQDEFQSRLTIITTYLKHQGPTAKYEIMERYGLSSGAVTTFLSVLEEKGDISQGSFVGTKDTPQWCWRRTLEELHRRSLHSLKEYVKPVSKNRYIDYMVKWQHVHPDFTYKGEKGVLKAVKDLQMLEEHITCWERYFLGVRVSDYTPEYLDTLIQQKKVFYGRFNVLPEYEEYTIPNRGVIQLCCKEDSSFIVNSHIQKEYFEDLHKECEEIAEVLTIWPKLSFEGIVTGTQMNRFRIGRAVTRLFQVGVLTNSSYNVVRDSVIITGLSAGWDLSSTPEEVSDKEIFENIIKKDIKLTEGKWSLIKRGEYSVLDRVRQLFQRYGIVTTELLKQNNEAVTSQEFAQAVRVLMLRGEVRKGQFVTGLDRIQYATPEAVEFLRTITPDNQLVILNMKDPANLYGKLFSLTDEEGHTIKHNVAIANHVIIKNGTAIAVFTSKNYPGRYFNIEVTLLFNTPKKEMVEMIEKIVAYAKKSRVQEKFETIRFLLFNEKEIPGSGLDIILEEMGFSFHKRGYILSTDTKLSPVDGSTLDIPEVFFKVEYQEPEIASIQS
ncbi:MAG: ATP-dependent helicase [Candidatus Methanofastidiosia archaeon]|jgi:ATP-dependent Lhr-like helicase